MLYPHSSILRICTIKNCLIVPFLADGIFDGKNTVYRKCSTSICAKRTLVYSISKLTFKTGNKGKKVVFDFATSIFLSYHMNKMIRMTVGCFFRFYLMF